MNKSESKNGAYYDGYKAGYEQAKKDLGWHSVTECLPEVNKQVIVLTDHFNGIHCRGANRISFGHIVDKSKCTDYNGWNIPDVTFWMPCPKINEE